MKERYKVTLLRRAGRRGCRPLLDQAVLSVRDRFWSHRHLVFAYHTTCAGIPSVPSLPGLTFRTVECWDAISASGQRSIDEADMDWGHSSWFELGDRHLWLAEIDSRPASTVWWRRAERVERFYFPLPDGSILIGPVATLPKYRGRGVCPVTIRALVAHLAEEGATRFFIDCRDYNYPSRRTVAAAGFLLVGTATIRHLDGRRSWRPESGPGKR